MVRRQTSFLRGTMTRFSHQRPHRLYRSRLLSALLAVGAACLLAFAASCDGFFVSENSIQSVTVSPSAVLLQAGVSPADTFTFSSSAMTVGGGTNSNTNTATWSSSNSSVATADAGGVVTAVTSSGGQSATIFAKDGGQTGTATVFTYTGTPPGTLTLTFTLPNGATATTIPLGTSFKVKAIASLNGDTDISNFVSWTISNSTVNGVTIDRKGNVTVPSTGSAGSFTVRAVAQFGTAAAKATAIGTQDFTVV